ncbi:MAG: insulinase family protein, partial [Pseudomonadota bacterium]
MTSSFEHLHTQVINTLNVSVEAYRHTETGALHYHFDADNSENVFLVALRTLPTDSTGVAHILEHTALCGSERFPVRDPFFMMIRRSLNTFMNAFTSSDWTAYPFATQNKKDFDHLLQVYLDAVFFARLDPLDFAQEGHRMEFSEPSNPASGLEFKGVVFNEMKGAMSSISSTLWQALSKHLHTGTTYQYNSGGKPEDIPNLTHDELVAFYKKHYHPSNAIFMTFGDIPASEHQAQFEVRALNRFTRQTDTLRAEQQVRFTQPRVAEERYAYQADNATDSADSKHYFLLSWMLGDSIALKDVLEAQLMSGVLLDNSSSPLQKFLETTPLGSSPSSLCGVDTSSKEIVFCCGLEGAKSDDIDAFEEQILALLQHIVDNGVDQSLVESVLHQLELKQREVTGSSYPYGLSLMLAALPAALHDGNPIELLDIDAVLNDIRTHIVDPGYIPSLIQRWLLDNTHRVRLLVAPDSDLDANKAQQEADRLSKTAQSLSHEQTQEIINLAAQLTQRQEQQDDPNVLPKLTLSDIPEINTRTDVHQLNDTVRFYPKATNGLIYQDTRFKLPALSLDELSLLPLMTNCLTELGVGDHDYLTVQQQQSACTGGLSAFSQITRHTEGHLAAFWGLSTKALINNRASAQDLLNDTAHKVRFDEEQRIRELIQQIRASVERGITGNGHGFAMSAAASHHNELAAHHAIQSGLISIQRIKQLDDSLNDSEQLSALCHRMEGCEVTGRSPQRSPLDWRGYILLRLALIY